mgnify:CR=1 FL=1
MTKYIIKFIVGLLILGSFSYATDTHAEKAVKKSITASGNASASAAHAIVATGQVTSAASAIPLQVAGSIGTVSKKIGNELMKVATEPIGTPLVITDESITAGPLPSEAMKPKKQ